ncbi:hypothetical protein FVE85_3472 [Porphyridium purpureum]|uniref:Uncharacterized protein n=1 Tax=Porphyridium purpureum TaxID=35688 RepID=A0A5J4YMX0_PORPP|nr:hypothetical protein FVE85_3472 [Porphyridium purpureum]|eukprot:POR9029..scf249_10
MAVVRKTFYALRDCSCIPVTLRRSHGATARSAAVRASARNAVAGSVVPYRVITTSKPCFAVDDSGAESGSSQAASDWDYANENVFVVGRHTGKRSENAPRVDALLRLNTSVDPPRFLSELDFFLEHKLIDAAAELWKKYRTLALTPGSGADIHGEFLWKGAWICATTHNAEDAAWIAEQYEQLGLMPQKRTLGLLASTHIHAGQFELALKRMQWMVRLDFVLHQDELLQYLNQSLSWKSEQPLSEILLPLGDILVETRFLCYKKASLLGVLRAYFKALYKGVADGRLTGAEIHDAIVSAQRILERWKVADHLLWSGMVYLASRGERLDMALQVVRASHSRTHFKRSSLSDPAPGVLKRFAYEALVVQAVAENREADVAALIWSADGGSTMSWHQAAVVSSHFIHVLGGIGRLDLCSVIWDTFRERYDNNVSVINAYMFVLTEALRPREAFAIFRSFYQEGGARFSAPDGVTYSVLASALLKALEMQSGDRSADGMATSPDEVDEMVGYVEKYLTQLDDNASEHVRDAETAAQPLSRRALRARKRKEPRPRDKSERKTRANCLQEKVARIRIYMKKARRPRAKEDRLRKLQCH